jgi:hypothetical protein
MQQGRQGGDQMNALEGCASRSRFTAQHIAPGGIGGHGPLGIELTRIAHHPQQLAVVLAADPVAGHCGVLAGRLAQQAVEGVEALLGDGGLPVLAAALGNWSMMRRVSVRAFLVHWEISRMFIALACRCRGRWP